MPLSSCEYKADVRCSYSYIETSVKALYHYVEKMPEDILNRIINTVISEVEEEEWLSEDLFKSILNDDED